MVCGPNGGHFDASPGASSYKDKSGLSYNSGIYGFTQKNQCITITYWKDEVYFWFPSAGQSFKYNISTGDMSDVNLPAVTSRIGINVIKSTSDPITYFSTTYNTEAQILNSETCTVTDTSKFKSSTVSATATPFVGKEIHSFDMASSDSMRHDVYNIETNTLVTQTVKNPAGLIGYGISWAHNLGNNKFLLLHRVSYGSSVEKGKFMTTIFDANTSEFVVDSDVKYVEFAFKTLPGIRFDKFYACECNCTYRKDDYVYAFARELASDTVNIAGASPSWYRYDLKNKTYEIVHTIFNGSCGVGYSCCHSDYGVFTNPIYRNASCLSVTTFN